MAVNDRLNFMFVIDIDECAEDGYCDQTCVNTEGGYSCSCSHGYRQSTTNTHRCTAINGMYMYCSFQYIEIL